MLQVTPPQTSLAAAPPPLLFSQLVRSRLLPAPSHSTVKSLAATSMVGGVVSAMVNLAMVSALLPHSSVAVKVTVAAPVSPQSSDSAVKSLLQVTSPQISLAAAPPP